MNVTHHVVYSTKGGCGKTAFSLFLAQCEKSLKIPRNTQNGEEYEEKIVISPFLHNKNAIGFDFSERIAYLSEEEKKETGEIEYHVKYCKGNEKLVKSADYFIDFDLLGSSLQLSTKLLYDGKKKVISLQDIIKGDSNVSEISPVSLCRGWTWKYKQINVLPVGVRESEKEMFHVKRYNTPLLRYEEMQKQLSGIQQDIIVYQEILKDTKSEKVAEDIHIVYDLPPNADSYTDAVFYEIFDRVKKNKNEKILLYLVSNSEYMLKCNIDWLSHFCATHKYRECPIIIVNNDNVNSFVNEETASDNFIDSLVYANLNKKTIDLIKSVLYFKQNDIRVELFSMGTTEAISIKPKILNKEKRCDNLEFLSINKAMLSLFDINNVAFVEFTLW